MITDLPEDIIKKLMEYLDIKSIVNLISSNKQLNNINNIIINKNININNIKINKNFIFKSITSNFYAINNQSINIESINSLRMVKNKNFYNIDLNKFENLISIVISNTGLYYFPEIKKLKNLKYIDLSFNNIDKIPEDLPDNIETMYLDYNEIKFVPKLPKSLKIISLTNNLIDALPMNSFPENVKHIHLERNYSIEYLIEELREKYKKSYISY